jgi:hypothetical protein
MTSLVTISADLFAYSDAGVSANAQSSVYSALYWLKNNTSTDSVYLSISDWRFTYSSIFFGRTTIVSYSNSPIQAVNTAKEVGAGYVIVTKVVTAEVFPWNYFQNPPGLSLIYTNDDVKIYKI